MMIRKWYLAVLVVLSAPVLAATSAVQVVESTTDRLYTQINENRAQYEKHPEELACLVREILLPKLDVTYSGRLVLGPHARDLTDKQIEEFSNALSAMLIDRYASQLIEFNTREQVEVLPVSSEATEEQTRVQTRINLETGQSVPVDYVMHRTEEGWQVFDVVVEGISYVVTFRGQINDALSRYSFEEVLERIERGELAAEA